MKSYLSAVELQTLANEYIYQLTMAKFDAKLADATLSQFSVRPINHRVSYSFSNIIHQGAPKWLNKLITDAPNRQLVYALARAHKHSEFLAFTISMISKAGFQLEIATLESSANFFNVFSDVLSKLLDKLLDAKSELELEQLLPDFLVPLLVSLSIFLAFI